MFFFFRPFPLLWFAVLCAVASGFAIYLGWSVPHGRGWTLVVAGCLGMICSLALAWSMLRVIGSFAWMLLTFGFRR